MKLTKLKGGKGYTTFGCMWKKGECKKDDSFSCIGDSGNMIPVQSRITAFWPDGSVKWTAHTADSSLMGDFAEIGIGRAAKGTDRKIEVLDKDGFYEVLNGKMKLLIPKKGEFLFTEIIKGSNVLAKNCRPELILQNPTEIDGRQGTVDRNYFGVIESVEVEEEGDLQCIFKYFGTHKDGSGDEKLQFVIRLRVDLDSDDLNLMHTFIYDGDENRDFLKGLGISFESPIKGEPYNRHVKFMGDNGVFHESVMTMVSWRPRTPEGYDRAQMQGMILDPKDKEKEIMDRILEDIPLWDTYDICQDSATHFEIRKKLAGDGLCFVDALHGQRAVGAFAFGSPSSSVIAGIRDFWEKYPSGYTVSGLTKDLAKCTLWLWSPEARPMDFRHYATRGYNQVCYEGYDYKGADPYGIACTNEIALRFSDEMIPSDEEMESFAESYTNPPVYTGSPEYYHDLHAFGYWSLPSDETETEKWLERQLEKAFEFYKNEVEQRNWYGMFNYGDFMHTYDPARHVWRYDVGGYAWDNTELVPTLWLWLYFMRTGRADVFELAEKLSRHASEVDVYHIGKYKGMGSRHNVRHWGCPCKETRIAMAGHHRYYYYLTGDRRLEDIFDELKDNEKTFLNRDPLGDFYEKKDMKMPSHARSGPDWSSLCYNWLTEWERKNDPVYRHKIEIGSDDIKKAPLKLVSGPDFEFDPDTLHLGYIGERTTGGTHLQICMGAPSVWTEMADLLEDEEWKDMIAEYGRIYFLSSEERTKVTKGLVGKREFSLPMFACCMGGYGAVRLKDKGLAENVWRILLNSLISLDNTEGFSVKELPDTGNRRILDEIPWISTNFVAQFCLNVIMTLEFIRDSLPKTLKEVQKMIDAAGTAETFRKA
ncbi:MAG: hypothetical protein K6F63_05255 [Lachnospiraceae bacterium]|nr:hypothetical protein [Lachnospiraceae bacterium]